MSDEQRPVAVVHSVHVGGVIKGSLRVGVNAAEILGKPLYLQPKPKVDAGPDWGHPKIQALIAADARNKIVIDLIWQLIDNPECELTAMDMEYWSSIHEILKNRLTLLTSKQPLTDDQIDALQLPESGAGTIRDLVRIIEAAHGIGGCDE